MKTLAEFLADAVKMARANFDPEGQHAPTFIAEQGDGTMAVYVTPWENEESRAAVLDLLRARFAATRVARYAAISEAWTAHIDEHMDEAIKKLMPRQRMDRGECMVIGAVSKTEAAICCVLDIQRKEDGSAELAERDMKGVMIGGELLGLIRQI